MNSMRSLLDPKAIAVVGASQRRGRGTNVIANLRDCGFAGEIFAVNPRYQDVLGYRCFPSVSDLPAAVDCLVVAVAADAACDVLDEAHAHGIRAAIVLAAGFGEGGHGQARAARLRSLADLLVGLGRFAIANSGRFRALDLNPIMVGSSGVAAVDIAIEPVRRDDVVANAAE